VSSNIIDQFRTKPKPQKSKVISYTLRGYGDTPDKDGIPYIHSNPQSPNVHAQRVEETDGTVRHYVKVNDRTKYLYNPLQEKMYDGKFTEVKQVVFDLYIRFLRGNDPLYLRHAEREFKNG
jgi:hypothetical protein